MAGSARYGLCQQLPDLSAIVTTSIGNSTSSQYLCQQLPDLSAIVTFSGEALQGATDLACQQLPDLSAIVTGNRYVQYGCGSTVPAASGPFGDCHCPTCLNITDPVGD